MHVGSIGRHVRAVLKANMGVGKWGWLVQPAQQQLKNLTSAKKKEFYLYWCT